MERRRAGSRDCAGGGERDGTYTGMDESRRARAHGRNPGGALLVAFARPTLAQGRDVGTRATRARDKARLRQRHDPAHRRTKGWNRLSYRAAPLFLPAPRGWGMARGGPRAQGPKHNLRKMR